MCDTTLHVNANTHIARQSRFLPIQIKYNLVE